MKKNKKVLELVLKKIERQYKDDISLLVLYGVNRNKVLNDLSGIDFYFIPKNEKGKSLSFQFIIEDVSYDLFPMSWDRLIQNAALDSPQAYLLTESDVVYSSSDEDLARFNKLKEDVSIVQTKEYAPALLNKAYEYFNEVYIYLYNMNLPSTTLLDVRIESSKVLSKIANAIGFVNQTYYDGGNGSTTSIYAESLELKKTPVNYESLLRGIISANSKKDIVDQTEALVKSTRDFLLIKKKRHAQIEPFETFFKGYYEELKEILNRFNYACEVKDQLKLFALASYIHEELSQFMMKVESGLWFDDRNYYSEYSKVFDEYFGINLLDLVAKKDYNGLKEAITTFEHSFINLLSENDITLAIYSSIEDFEIDFMSE
ncbi:hypothetical protein RJG79_11670 [Mycoplasmatota bacterium WC44]